MLAQQEPQLALARLREIADIRRRSQCVVSPKEIEFVPSNTRSFALTNCHEAVTVIAGRLSIK